MTTNQKRESLVCSPLAPFGVSIFTEVTEWCNRSGAVNLSQGFPDFDGPLEIRKIAADSILKGPNQYSPSNGLPVLRQAVANKMKRFYDVDVDFENEITITHGATEALASTLMGLLEPGDEVILFEPTYDLYPPVVARAGAKAVYVSLDADDFSIPADELAEAFSSKTKLVVVNNPQNPCGKVFGQEELELIASLAEKWGAYVLGDEVYEHLTYDGHKHTSLLQLPRLRERAVVVSSTAKTFSMTGWKVGFAIASPKLTEAVRMSHQFMTYCTPAPFQEAMAQAIAFDDDYFEKLRQMYAGKRHLLCDSLEGLGFKVLWPEGTYYANVDIRSGGYTDDVEFARHLTLDVGVAAIPSSVFWKERRRGRHLVRFCFCKKDETLKEALQKLEDWQK